MSCTPLVKKYEDYMSTVANSPQPLPEASAPVQERLTWLLKQNWYCVDEQNGNSIHPEQECKTLPQTVDVYDAADFEGGTPSSKKEVKNGISAHYLEEKGFLDWVNKRGSRCLNRITGKAVAHNFRGSDGKGVPYEPPGRDRPFPKSYCAGACFNPNPDQVTCFECVKQVLETESSVDSELLEACPELYDGKTTTQVDTDLIQQALQCHQCIGDRFNGLVSEVKNDNGTVTNEYNPKRFDELWGCVTGDIKGSLSAGGLTAIIFVSIFVFGLIVACVMWNRYKRKTQEKSRQQQLVQNYGYTVK